MPAEVGEQVLSPQKFLPKTTEYVIPPLPQEFREGLFKEKSPDDEFNNKDKTLPIFKSVSVIRKSGTGVEEVNFDQMIQGELDYQARTKDLEVSTERTAVLQNIVDRMTLGTDVKTRVVIMRKGHEANAFVTPDGTVFVAQALINTLDSIDEIGGVLAHELGHLINKTFVRKVQSRGPIDSVGLGWLHEATADMLAPVLLEKVNLNSFGFSKAIKKIAEGHRGFDHQTGLSRAAQSVGQHWAVDFHTSALPETPISNFLYQAVYKTNKEMLQAYKNSKKEGPELDQLLRSLHPWDLETVYDYGLRVVSPQELLLQEKGLSIIKERILSAGHTEMDSRIFGFVVSTDNLPFTTPESVVDFINNIEEFEKDKKFDSLYREVFNKDKHKSAIPKFLTKLKYAMNVNYSEKTSFKGLIPVNEDTMINILAKLSNSEIAKNLSRSDGSFNLDGEITEAALQFAVRRYSDNETALQSYFEKVKEAGIRIEIYIIDRFDKDQYLALRKTFAEVFGARSKEEVLTKKELEEEFEQFRNGYSSSSNPELNGERVRYLGYILGKYRQYFKENNLNDSQRIEFIKEIEEAINNMGSIDIPGSLEKYLASPLSKLFNHDLDGRENNHKLYLFNLKMIVGLSLFEKDGNEFYSYMFRIMDESGIDHSKLSRTQLLNLCQGLIDTSPDEWQHIYLLAGVAKGEEVTTKCADIRDFKRFSELPFIKAIMEKEEPVNASSIKGLNEKTVERLKSYHKGERVYNGRRPEVNEHTVFSLFGEDIRSLILGQEIREEFIRLIEKGVPEEQFDDLYRFVNNYFSEGEQKSKFLREISKKYLQSDRNTLDAKTTYLIAHLNQVGPEGMVMVAEQIKTLSEYRKFRDRLRDRITQYLEGGMEASVLATIDNLTSQFNSKSGELFNTAFEDPNSKEWISTNFAKRWMSGYVLGFTGDYRLEGGKFALSEKTRVSFRSIKETFSLLKGLTNTQRFFIVHKALTDKEGSLTSVPKRTALGEVITKALDIKNPFISSVIKNASERAEAEIVTFPVARMLGPLLFRGLDVAAVNTEEVMETEGYDSRNPENWRIVKLQEVISKEEIQRLITAETRDLTVFGSRYREESALQRLSTQSDEHYHQVIGILDQLLAEKQVGDVSTAENNINPVNEAVIRGVEGSGALGVRALQLVRQLYKFSPDVDRRLGETFDSNPGINKLLFWEYLIKLAETQPEIKDYIENKLVTLDPRLGGGSLYTVYGAKVKDEAGNLKEVVIRMLNPNARGLLIRSYEVAEDSLKAVLAEPVNWRDKSSVEKRKQAKLAYAMLKLSRDWCEKDIDDEHLIQDDKDFRGVIDEFNAKYASETVYAPELGVTLDRFKSEGFAKGSTLNKLLADQTIPIETKQKALDVFARFFAQQFKTNKIFKEDGDKYRLIHSDPHSGNYIVETNTDGSFSKMAMIDRNFYLRLSEREVNMMKALMKGDSLGFAFQFLDRMLGPDKISNPLKRLTITNRVVKALVPQLIDQARKGELTEYGAFQTVTEVLEQNGISVPLEIQLGIKNIRSVNELLKRNGVNLKSHI